MTKNRHAFHQLIGKLVDANVDKARFDVKLDTACAPEKRHRLSLFSSKEKSLETRFADVDIVIIDKLTNSVQIIIEIEETNLKPNHIFGKYLASAMSTHYAEPTDEECLYPIADNSLFIQILEVRDVAKVKHKKAQWASIESKIHAFLRCAKSSIKEYRLISGSIEEFEGCIFRSMSTSDSDPCRPPVPG